MSHLKWATTALGAAALLLLAGACGRDKQANPAKTDFYNRPNDPGAIRDLMKPASAPAPREGIAAAILLDTSLSMSDPVQGTGQQIMPKIKVAQKALLDVLQKFSDFAGSHRDNKILVGIYDFSARQGRTRYREVIKLAPPDVSKAKAALETMVPAGGTPIGDAMIAANRDLNATGLNHRHILVITDGENNLGYLPGDVAKVIAQAPEAQRTAIYFIAFDIGADVFEPVREAGGLVLAADNAKQLTDTLDFILTGKILVEQPPPPAGTPHPSFRKK